MQYFVMKSGMAMYDVCRAYGLALAIDRLNSLEGLNNSVLLKNLGTYYLIEGPEITVTPEALEEQPEWGEMFDILLDSLNWRYVFLTTLSTSGKEKKVKTVQQILTEKIRKILTKYANQQFSYTSPSQKKGFETIPQSLDVTASKGIRRERLDKYDDGSQIYVEDIDCSIACLGAAHYSYWSWGEFAVSIVPDPKYVVHIDHREIQDTIKKEKSCNVSVLTILASYAVNLMNKLRQFKASRSLYNNKYSTLIFNAMVKTGNQWKPSSGGFFPLEILHQLIESDLVQSEMIFNIWQNLFRQGRRPGFGDLAISLAEFLLSPTLQNLEQHFKIHLRYALREDAAVKLYENKNLKEMMQIVGT